MKKARWIAAKSKLWSFSLEGIPEAIHIVQSENHDLYIVVHDDAYIGGHWKN
jgi:hypothetical protein